MSVGRLCVREVHLAEPHESVRTAAARLRDRHVGSLVVLEEGRPVGLLTDRDLVVRVLAAGTDPERVQVRDVMSRELHTLHEDQPIEAALSLMRSGPFRRVPIVGDDGRLVGIVTLDDVVDLLAEEAAEIAELLGRQAPPKVT